ncbi:acid phosphatase [Vibrio genomosp. F6]|uniref:acid phosphatase n=1 Tax=Vibrio genomosp. F6 TaxID=723172 RepID=UPI0010BD02BA|nr:acid phosphatase [Vibrio genomosp. F6]TKF23581.1 acid phosphatase [Vibrio genomosp. F6]
MKKITLLAASVAVALTGCGGGSSSSDGAAPQVSIASFDGYFKNAVMFVDSNDNGVWDEATDEFIGLTKSKGEVTMTEKPSGIIAVQTLTPGGPAQAKLISLDADKYAGVYTVDMDHPAQPMAHEVVFRARNGSDVISPITDLSLSYVEKGLTEEDLVADLGLESTDELYTDFVDGEDKNTDLHKTAQLLTETKGSGSDINSKPQEFVQDAKQSVDSMTPEQKADPSYKAPVDGDKSTSETPTYKTTVNAEVYKEVQNKFDSLNLTLGDKGSSDYFFSIDINNLFEDKDISPDESFIEVAGIKVYDNDKLNASNVKAVINYQTGILNVGVSPSDTVDLAGDITLDLVSGNSDLTNSLKATFSFTVDKGEAKAPTYSDNGVAGLQTQVNLWELTKGKSLGEGYTLDFSTLFSSDDQLTLSFSSNALTNGLIFDNMGTGIIGVQGTPLRSKQDDDTNYKIKLKATDASGLSTIVELDLPDVQEALKPDTHPLEGKTWYILEHGSSNGEAEQEYSSIWCDSIKFEDGIVLGNVRSIANKTTCTEADTQTEEATYEIVDGSIVATFHFEEDGEKLTEKFQVEVANDADSISTGAKTIVHRLLNSDEESAERYTYFINKADIEKRLNVTSEMGPEARTFNAYLPAEEDNAYNLGQIGLSLRENAHSNDQGEMDANLSFDVNNTDFTCETVNEFFSNFYFTGEDIGSIKSKDYTGSSIECYTSEEDGIKHASVDFDLPSLTVNNVYSVIGKVKDNNGEFMEAMKFNIKWTGTSNND